MGKQLPPYPAPANKNDDPILLSRPIACKTAGPSDPTFSDNWAIALAKDIFVASIALEVYLISSADAKSVTTLLPAIG